jgi:hypothetical protein
MVDVSRPPAGSRLAASLTHVLVEQHPDHEGERVAAEELIGGGVLGDGECRHACDLAARGPRGDRSAAGRRTRDDIVAVERDGAIPLIG